VDLGERLGAAGLLLGLCTPRGDQTGTVRLAIGPPKQLPHSVNSITSNIKPEFFRTLLSRLWQQQGKKSEAHSLLAEIYGWFTEGFDTKDLQEAKALLEALGGQ